MPALWVSCQGGPFTLPPPAWSVSFSPNPHHMPPFCSLHAAIYWIVRHLTLHICLVWLNVSSPRGRSAVAGGVKEDLRTWKLRRAASGCWRMCYFAEIRAPTLWQTHRIRKSFSVLPAKLVSSFIPGCRCLWVKYLWKIAMIGFIMLPAVSRDGNEFGILGWKKKISFLKISAC